MPRVRHWGMAWARAERVVGEVCERLREAAIDLPRRDGLELAPLVARNLDRLT